MKWLIPLFVLMSIQASAQSRLKKLPIGNSGCAAYFYCNPGEADLSYSPDSSQVYTMSCNDSSLNYGLICIRFNASMLPLSEPVELMTQYMEFLKTSFEVTQAAGFGKGHTLAGQDGVSGVIDYWTTKDGNEIQVKSWTDGKGIGFMYVKGSSRDLSNNYSKVQVYFNGFRFH